MQIRRSRLEKTDNLNFSVFYYNIRYSTLNKLSSGERLIQKFNIYSQKRRQPWLLIQNVWQQG